MARPGPVIEAPPSRYRVVERGRRLEVIDTRRADALNPPSGPRQRAPITASLPRRTAFDGSAQLTTSAFYDDKAPRTIALDPASATIVRWAYVAAVALAAAFVIAVVLAPWLLAVIPVVIDKRARKPLRARITRWLDTVEREAT